MGNNNKNYVVKWEEKEPADRKGIHYFVSFWNNKLHAGRGGILCIFHFLDGNNKILRSSYSVEDALYMNHEEVNNKLSRLKKSLSILKDIEIEYTGPIKKISRFEIMDI